MNYNSIHFTIFLVVSIMCVYRVVSYVRVELNEYH